MCIPGCWTDGAWRPHQHRLSEVGLRGMFGPTGEYREYFDRLTAPLEPLDASPREAEIVRLAEQAIVRAAQPPFAPHLQRAMQATRAIADVVRPWLTDYATEIEGDTLPSLWSRSSDH